MYITVLDNKNKCYRIKSDKDNEELCSISFITKKEKNDGVSGRCKDDANVISRFLAISYNRFLGLL